MLWCPRALVGEVARLVRCSGGDALWLGNHAVYRLRVGLLHIQWVPCHFAWNRRGTRLRLGDSKREADLVAASVV